MDSGYVMNFSDGTFRNFVLKSIEINIDDEKYKINGTSKAKRLRAFFDLENNETVATLLYDLTTYWEDTIKPEKEEPDLELVKKCFAEIEALNNGKSIISAKFAAAAKAIVIEDKTINDLKKSLETELKEHRFGAALDRLHTFSVKFFRTKCLEVGIKDFDNKPLHSLVGEYVKTIERSHKEMTIVIMKASVSIFDKFNKIRNEHSLAHDNDILEDAEAKYIVEWLLSTITYIDSLK